MWSALQVIPNEIQGGVTSQKDNAIFELIILRDFLSSRVAAVTRELLRTALTRTVLLEFSAGSDVSIHLLSCDVRNVVSRLFSKPPLVSFENSISTTVYEHCLLILHI